MRLHEWVWGAGVYKGGVSRFARGDESARADKFVLRSPLAFDAYLTELGVTRRQHVKLARRPINR